jgi:UDP-glucose 4-epimerase
VKKIIFSSSCAVYGSPHYLPLTEQHPIAPMSPYGQTKAMAESIFADAARAYGLQYVCLRYFNAAGALPEEGLGEQHKYETHLIPRLLKAALYKTPFTIFGTNYPTKDGSAVRDFVHVIDIAQAHLLALGHLDKGMPSDCFNLGTATGYSIKEVIDEVQRICNAEIKLIQAGPREGDPHILVADASKASSILGWQPRYSDLYFILQSAFAFSKLEALVNHAEVPIIKCA